MSFNIIRGINESKTVIKHISCECQCKFDSINVVRIKIGLMINIGVSAKI